MNKINIDISKLYTTKEIAHILGVSRVAAFNRIKKGHLKALMVGKSYVVKGEDLSEYLSPSGQLTENEKVLIEKVVKKVVKVYGEALKQLGQE